MASPLGLIIYDGPSMLDGFPIIAIATVKTNNAKTGNMVQLWIIRSDMAPTVAKDQGADDSVCGMCPHRHSLGGGCYVVLFHAPNNVYKSWKAGNYAHLAGNEHMLRGRRIRLGAYGDPAAVPFDIIDSVVNLMDGVTGYTHQFHHPNFDSRILKHCMVSVDTEASAARMARRGLRYFRVKSADMPVLENEIECPADENIGMTCLNCQFCNGAAHEGRSVVINSHGVRAKRFDNKFGIPVIEIQ